MEKEVEQNTSIEPQTEEQEQQPNKKFKERLKERFKETSVGKWLYANPKKFYFYAMTFLVLSFIGSTIWDIRLSQQANNGMIPMLYEQSSKIIRQNENRQEQMQNITEELKGYKAKRELGELTPSDSLRIEFLYQQYQTLQNQRQQ
jgi:hypothetical protein